jgi:hypothetical protein
MSSLPPPLLFTTTGVKLPTPLLTPSTSIDSVGNTPAHPPSQSKPLTAASTELSDNKLIDPKTLDVHQRIRAKLAIEKEAEERRLVKAKAGAPGRLHGKQSGSSAKQFSASNRGQLDMRTVDDQTRRQEDEQMFHTFTAAFEKLFGIKVRGGI